MKLSIYQVFLKACEKKNFSQAAQELFLTQPAVSQMMSSLEEELQTTLFVRLPRGVQLTEEGQAYYLKVKEAMKLLSDAEELLSDRKALRSGVLRLAVSDMVSRYLLPETLKLFSRKYPALKVRILSGTTKELEEHLRAGDVDLVIGFIPDDERELIFHELLRVHDGFVASEELLHSLPEKPTIQDLKKHRIMMLDRRSESRKRTDATLLANGIELKPDIELASHDLLIEFARHSLGIALLTLEFSEDLKEIKLPLSLPSRPIGYYYRKSSPLTKASEAFIDLLTKRGSE
ncbi:LysR family transcriptional regulator [Guggenheimella bovis]